MHEVVHFRKQPTPMTDMGGKATLVPEVGQLSGALPVPEPSVGSHIFAQPCSAVTCFLLSFLLGTMSLVNHMHERPHLRLHFQGNPPRNNAKLEKHLNKTRRQGVPTNPKIKEEGDKPPIAVGDTWCEQLQDKTEGRNGDLLRPASQPINSRSQESKAGQAESSSPPGWESADGSTRGTSGREGRIPGTSSPPKLSSRAQA